MLGITPGIYLFVSATIVTAAMQLYNRHAAEQYHAAETDGCDTNLNFNPAPDKYTRT